MNNSLVSLYSRVNAQNLRTRFVHIPKNERAFTSNQSQWSPLHIRRIVTPSAATHSTESSILCYGCVVQFFDPLTGFESPHLRIHKVEKNFLCGDVLTSPISQFHKIGLELVESSSSPPRFLSTAIHQLPDAADGKLLDFTPVLSEQNKLTDCQCWTIVGISSFVVDSQSLS